jgi:hypothetical protein
MAKEELVAGFKLFAQALEEAAGPVALLMLLPVDPASEAAWTVLVSAHGFDGRSQHDSIQAVVAQLNALGNAEVMGMVKKVGVLRTDEPFVKAMNSAIRAEGSVIDMTATTVAGVEIPRAILFESKRIAA